MGHRLRIAASCGLLLGALAWAVLADEPYGRHQVEGDARDHWAFQSVKRPQVPTGGDAAWIRNPIDAFVLARLKEAGLKPAGPATQTTLLRRVYLDLIGLPPTPAELDAFLADPSPLAFEKVVDDLLSRPQYGERWARHWLDVVRYAETNGYERDGLKPQAWRYRDWAIDAFNTDKPYDRFVIEQLAGDEIADSDAESQIATTMLRLGPWDDEPADSLADRYDQLDDIVAATSATFLGLTLRCARCHDHKFEPFSQKDYTRWQAIFAPLKRPQRDREDLDRDVGPHALVAAHHAQVKQLDDQRGQIEQQMRSLEWQVCRRATDEGRLPPPAGVVTLAATSEREGQTWRYTFDEQAGTSWAAPDFDHSAWKTGVGGFGTPGTAGAVVRTEWNTGAIWLRREFQFAGQALAELHLRVEHDEDFEVYLNGVPAAAASGFITEYRDFPVSPEAKAALRPGLNVLAVHCKHGSGGQGIDVGFLATLDKSAADALAQTVKDVPADALAALVAQPDKRNDAQKKLLAKHAAALKTLARKLADDEGRAQLGDCDKQLETMNSKYPTPLVKGYIWYEEGPNFGPSRVFRRGDPRNAGDEVASGFPAVLVDAPPPAPAVTDLSTGRRLQLARWLTTPEHPLTARVMVNRLWQHHFGDGLVGTENDFGVMGAAPSNQPLLDWLAAEFVAGGWRIKRMHRLMVLSQAYRMASTSDPAAEKIDPQGSLLWRFTPRRMEAESLRDTILSVSGQLNPTPRGPGVYPKISREVLETQSRPGDGWRTSAPNDAARRSVYIFVKRTLLVPELEVLDFPSTEETCEQRVVSTVAPQALTFLNGEFIHEQAKAFAERVAREAGADTAARVDRAYRSAVLAFLAKQQAQIEADSQGKPPPEAIQLQSLSALCLVLLNTNELAYVQ